MSINDTRKTLKDFFNDPAFAPDGTASAGTDSVTLSNLEDKSGDGVVDDLGTTPTGADNCDQSLLNFDDYDMTAISVLGDYLSYITQHFHREGPNEFFIEKGNETAPPTERGSVIPQPDDLHGAESTFSDSAGLNDTLSSYSNSGYFDDASGSEPISDLINKTGDTSSLAPTGHTLYNKLDASVTNADETQEPVRSSFDMLKANNRFNGSSSTFEYGSEWVSDGSDKAFAMGQSKKGEYSKQASPSTATNAHEFKFENLKQVGYEMLKNAAQNGNDHDTFAQDVSPRATDSSPFTSDASSLKSGAFEDGTQAEIKIKKSLTSPDNKFVERREEGGQNVNDEYFHTVFEKFITKLESTGYEGQQKRFNNSVYTINPYNKSVAFALEVLFPVGGDAHLDPFYANIASSILNIINEEEIEGTVSNAKLETDKGIAYKFVDSMAVIGDVMLTLTTKETVGNTNILTGGYYDVDGLKEGPATRISKSKTSQNGPNSKSLAWRGSSLPALYHLPKSVISSVQRMGAVNGQNPMKGMLAGGLTDKTYMSLNIAEELEDLGAEWAKHLGQGGGKIPKMLVERMENQLDAEYVPFYFHDLRTNEIITFHAFLNDLTDGFSANYSDNDGFGRMDPVKIYKNTTRDIGFSFKVAATSEQDFDEMWFKINKLITLVYPQWSAGEKIHAGDTTFTKPFSQVPTASPVIRLRIGDVIKTNYSRFNLSRIFGSGEKDTKIAPGDVGGTSLLALIGAITEALPLGGFNLNHFVQDAQILISEVTLKLMLAVIGSPLQYVELIPDDTAVGDVLKNIAFDIWSDQLRNGFMSPAVNAAFDRLRDPDGPGENSMSFGVGAQVGDAVMLKPSNGKYYIKIGKASGVKDRIPLIPFKHNLTEDNTNIHARDEGGMTNSIFSKVFTTRHIKCRVIGKKKNPETGKTDYSVAVVNQTSSALESTLEVLPVDNAWKTQLNKENVDLAGSILTVSYDDFVMDPDYLFGTYFATLLDPITGIIDSVQSMIDTFAGGLGIDAGSINLFTTTFEDLMHPVNNSIVKSFETTNGRGLAGIIKSISFNWIDGDNTPWETSFGGRAPKICDIKIKFEPIHDIAPGLDSDGFNRAPTHNVGAIMNNLAGDPYEKGYDAAKKSFDNAMNEATRTKKTS